MSVAVEPLQNKHESPRAKEIADNNTILLTQVGSGLHGVTIAGTDDRDEMGVCIEPPSCVIGIEKVPVINAHGFVNYETFGQYQYRSQPEGVRSGPGDLDQVIYSLRKWARLAAQGNPTVLLLLFAPRHQLVTWNGWGADLQASKDLFLSKECGRRFIGYLNSQQDRMLGLRSPRTNRPELVDVHGFDTKFAYHAVRLGLQGVELLQTGNITLPIPEPENTWLHELRLGEHSKEEALRRVRDLRADLYRLLATVDLPDRPDIAKLNRWLIGMYQSWWSGQSQLTSP